MRAYDDAKRDVLGTTNIKIQVKCKWIGLIRGPSSRRSTVRPWLHEVKAVAYHQCFKFPYSAFKKFQRMSLHPGERNKGLRCPSKFRVSLPTNCQQRIRNALPRNPIPTPPILAASSKGFFHKALSMMKSMG